MTEQTENPIFVRGMSRSGGTLMVTMLDAHPEIAMSYELYPTLLEVKDGTAATLLKMAKAIDRAWSMRHAVSRVEDQGLRTFLSRCPRGGLDYHAFAAVLKQHVDAGDGLSTSEERLRLIARCCRFKMEREGKLRWGLKCNNRYADYLAVWPRANFINILRDGRDVLASQLRTGSFKNSPAEVGASWAATHRRFRQLQQEVGVRALEVRYEMMTRDPESEMRRVCDFLGVPFDPTMLEFHRKKLTIFGTSHLSMDRISVPVDTAKIGRWQRELTPEQIAEFEKGAGDALAELGYSS
jgi:hypothetical protein